MSEYAQPFQRFSDWPIAAKVVLGFLVLILLVIVWSVLASAIFLVGTGLLKPDVVPFIQWWLYFMAYGWHHPVVGQWLMISAVSATAVPVVLTGARLARGGGLGGANRALHGKTRWATRKEMKRAGLYAPFRGLYVGKDKDGRYLRFGGEEHVACYAPSRSGKGVGLVIPNCMLYDGSLVCLDVKKENWAATAGIRKAAGQKVFLFDPLAPDGRTARYNPFGYVRRGTVDAFDDVQRIAQMVFPHVSGDQQFWTDAGRSAFIGAACFLAETPGLPLTFGEVLRLLSSSAEAERMLERIAARRLAGKPYSEATVKLLEDYLRGSPDLVNSIRKTVTARLSLWANPRVDAATSANDFDLRNLRQYLHAIYIGVTPDNIARLRPLLALLFQQIVDLSVRTLPKHDPTVKYQLLMLLDEFPLLGPLPVLADAFSYVAGYGLRIMLIMQSKVQLRDRALYGPDKAAAILDNCGLEVVFGTKDLGLTEELSARLGFDTVQGSSRTGQRFWRMFQRQSETNSEQKRALMLPQEIQKLPASEAILIRPGMFPIRCDRIEYFNDATFKNLELRPPDIEPITIEIRLDRGHGSLEKPVVKPQAPAPGTPALAGIKADVEDSEAGKEGFADPTSPAVPQRRTTPK